LAVLALEWTWHSAETNLRCVRSSGICMPNLNSLDLIVSEISVFIRTDIQTDKRTDGHGEIDLASEPDQEYIYLWGPSACNILYDESSIPFYSTGIIIEHHTVKKRIITNKFVS